MKYCNFCKQKRTLAEFGKRVASVDGLNHKCKKCNVKSVSRWRVKNPESYLLQHAKEHSRKSGIEFSITEEDILIPEVCPVFKKPLVFTFGSGTINPDSPSLDRINNSDGYTKGNIWVISWRANSLKRDGTKNEFKALVENWPL